MSGKDKTIGINDYLAHLDDDQFRAALLRKLQEQLQTRIKRDKKRNFRALRTAVVGWAKPSRRRSLLIPKEQTFSQRLTSAVGSDSKFRIHFDFDCFKRYATYKAVDGGHINGNVSVVVEKSSTKALKVQVSVAFLVSTLVKGKDMEWSLLGEADRDISTRILKRDTFESEAVEEKAHIESLALKPQCLDVVNKRTCKHACRLRFTVRLVRQKNGSLVGSATLHSPFFLCYSLDHTRKETLRNSLLASLSQLLPVLPPEHPSLACLGFPPTPTVDDASVVSSDSSSDDHPGVPSNDESSSKGDSPPSRPSTTSSSSKNNKSSSNSGSSSGSDSSDSD